MQTDEKVRENRIRRQAERLGFTLRKSRVRTLHHDDHGEYRIIDVDTNTIVAGEKFDWTLDDVDEWLTSREEELRKERES